MWLDEIEEREKLASEAPWEIVDDCLAHPVQVSEDEWEAEQLSEYIEGEGNRKFIANARDDIPQMARVIRELVEYIKLEKMPMEPFTRIEERVGEYNKLSDDAKELIR